MSKVMENILEKSSNLIKKCEARVDGMHDRVISENKRARVDFKEGFPSKAYIGVA